MGVRIQEKMSREIDAVVLVDGQGHPTASVDAVTSQADAAPAGVPFLTHLFSRIRKVGVEHVILGTAYEAEVYEKHFGTAAELG
jgi:mannose-1-phosphate guanylyltransferase